MRTAPLNKKQSALAQQGLEALKIAIAYFGTQQAFAKAIGTRQGHVSNWIHRSKKVPVDWVPVIVDVTNKLVMDYQLRPDKFKPN